MNIFEKLSSIATEIENVAKNLEVGTGKGSYKAVGEADVLKAVKPLEAKYKVYSYPIQRRIVESGFIENEVAYNGGTIIKKNLYERIETTYRFINIENPDEYVDIVSYGDGVDSQDKSVGKAMTYSDKYALMKAYKIVTGDDPDQDMSKPLVSIKAKAGVDTELEQVLKEAKSMGMNIEKVAFHFRKNPNDLTADEIKQAIEMQKNAKRSLENA